jgi:hypothetical protein
MPTATTVNQYHRVFAIHVAATIRLTTIPPELFLRRSQFFFLRKESRRGKRKFTVAPHRDPAGASRVVSADMFEERFWF